MDVVPVAIVGGGPVGLMLALFLDRHGVRSVVFNIERSVRPHPKGSSHNSRTMEHHRRLGIADAVRKLGLPPDYPTDVAHVTRLSGWELSRFRMPAAAAAARLVGASAPTDQVPEPIHRANQMYVEKLLLDHARTRSNVTLRFGWQVEDFDGDEAGVTLAAVPVGEGESEEWRARFLIGCDGARSFVRARLGIRYQGHDRLEQAGFGGRMISAHIRAPTLYRDVIGSRRAWQYWVISRQVRATIIALDGVEEFLMLSKPADPERLPDSDEVAQSMRLAIGADAPVEVIGHQPWMAGAALVADSYGIAPVLMAGDAVHLFTPTGGFGMNTGIDDAANLAWKLAATLQGWGGPRLIDSYEQERRPIGLRNTTVARAITRQVGGIEVSAALEEDGPAGIAARRETGMYIATYVAAEFAGIGVELGARYDGSPIIVPDGPPPTDAVSQYIPTSLPGGRAPHVWLGPGRGRGDSLFDRLGIGFTLLRLGASAPGGAAFERAAVTRGIPFATVDVAGSEARELYGCDLALVRPDQHIAWRGNAIPDDVDALLARVTGY